MEQDGEKGRKRRRRLMKEAGSRTMRIYGARVWSKAFRFPGAGRLGLWEKEM